VPSLALTILRQLEDGCNASSQTQRLNIQSSVDVITYLLNEKRNDIARLENKHEIKITLLPNPYMQFPNFTVTKQKGDKKQQHKSYQGISKPQYNLAENGLTNTVEEPAIDMNRPATRVPEKKQLSLFEKIKKALFGTKKKKTNKKRPNQNNQSRNRNRNRNRNKNRNKNQNKGQDNNQNKPQNKNQKPQNKPQNKNQKPQNKPQEKAAEKAKSNPQNKAQQKPKSEAKPKPQDKAQQKPKSEAKPKPQTEDVA
jgi:ribonuclease E